MRRLALAAALAATAACEDTSYRHIGAEVRVLANRNDAFVPSATTRLAAFGARAIPQIETALHTAAPAGRLNLVGALALIGDDAAAPILRHFAVYDVDASVRAACEDLLRRWAQQSAPAKAALARIAEKRAAGEAPLALP